MICDIIYEGIIEREENILSPDFGCVCGGMGRGINGIIGEERTREVKRRKVNPGERERRDEPEAR